MISTPPLVSIVTVCLNSFVNIERCINSVINQTYNNVEYIIVDGGSSDGTLDVIDKYKQNISFIVSENDDGVYDAMNKGVALASGEYVGILNSDDFYDKDTVRWVVDASMHNKFPDIVYGNMEIMGLSNTCIKVGSHHNMLKKWKILHPTCFVKRSLYFKYKFDTSYKISADYDLILYFNMTGKTFLHIDKVLTYFSPFGLSSKPSIKAVMDMFRIRSKYNLFIAMKMLLFDIGQYLDEIIYPILTKVKNFNMLI